MYTTASRNKLFRLISNIYADFIPFLFKLMGYDSWAT